MTLYIVIKQVLAYFLIIVLLYYYIYLDLFVIVFLNNLLAKNRFKLHHQIQLDQTFLMSYILYLQDSQFLSQLKNNYNYFTVLTVLTVLTILTILTVLTVLTILTVFISNCKKLYKPYLFPLPRIRFVHYNLLLTQRFVPYNLLLSQRFVFYNLLNIRILLAQKLIDSLVLSILYRK